MKPTHSFSFADDFHILMSLLNDNFKELYFSAPYYWGVCKANTIITFAEGDMYTYNCKDNVSFIKELAKLTLFLKDYNDRLFNQIMNYMKEES